MILGSKLNVILSRIVEILHSFHGCVVLLCHIENPQNITLQRYLYYVYLYVVICSNNMI